MTVQLTSGFTSLDSFAITLVIERNVRKGESENSHLLQMGKYAASCKYADLWFYFFRFSCFSYDKLRADLLAQLNPTVG